MMAGSNVPCLFFLFHVCVSFSYQMTTLSKVRYYI